MWRGPSCPRSTEAHAVRRSSRSSKPAGGISDVAGGFDPHSLPPFFTTCKLRNHLEISVIRTHPSVNSSLAKNRSAGSRYVSPRPHHPSVMLRLRTNLEQQMILKLRRQFRHAIGRRLYRAKVFSLAVVTHAIFPGLQSAQFNLAFPVGRGEERVIHFAVFRDGISLGRVVAGHVKILELSLG